MKAAGKLARRGLGVAATGKASEAALVLGLQRKPDPAGFPIG